jgi:hypothetical protein
MRARREVTLLVALSACVAFANVTIDAGAETPTLASNVAADPAIGTRIIGTDGANNNFYAYNQNGSLQQVVIVGLNTSADIRDGLLAVAVPNTGILFFVESSLAQATLADGGFPTINLSQVSQVALGEDTGGNTMVFANSGGTSVFRYQYGGDALTPVTLTGVPRGLAWFDNHLYATLAGSVVAIDSSGSTQTVIASDLGSSEGIVVTTIAGGTYALIASSSDSKVYVHRLSAPAGFVDSFSVKNGAAAVAPRYLAANNTTLVLQDALTANYKIVSLADVAAALQLSSSTSDAGTPGTPDAGHEGPGGVTPGGGGGAEPIQLCGCAAPPILLVPMLLLLMLRRKFRR